MASPEVPRSPSAEGEFLAAQPDVVERLREDLPDDEVLYDLAELFRMFADSTRIKILYALFESELCVGDIAQLLNLSQSSVSHQLRLLKNSKLVKFRREGKVIFYSLDDDHVRSMIALGMEHVEE
ncbi:helix-turn-helix transcriptional regulator [Subdoligranulum sp. DSM 109015]|uniref:Helix-turn-helix transcriptional regulator n=1 Tax=Gemmiger gallinarum TaxID=2779354 RepID=A0ABR9R564_9FIRM|nr:metalloregulator ArsR/SmtB family transcription factor [Gemmiger gallinarum]MBE5038274.1 helix-turn-helix transcriptional regulator [Gemmiger gallinarum]